MSDTERIISEFERCIELFSVADTSDDYFKCVCQRVLELLKKQGTVKPVLERIGNYVAINDYSCPVCKTDLYYKQKYCDECGRAVKWDETN
jgi:hypothetical protein